MTTRELFEFDRKYAPRLIAGVDEAGRGPLAGPVVCACCILPMDGFIDKVNDSKQLTEATREELYPLIIRRALAYSVSVVPHDVIDRINILEATKLGMKRAIEGLNLRPALVLVDAVTKLDVTLPTQSIIKGDAKSYHVAAASILAKVTRDRLMRDYDKQYPAYGFCRNKGYGTRAHFDALSEYGDCPIHRQTFLKKFREGTGENE